MSICVKKSESSEYNSVSTFSDDLGKKSISSCVVCYEPYEKVILTASQSENIFQVLCKCLRVKSANTAFDINCGSDFPLCECCSEFALDLVKLYKKLDAIREKIQEKVEEIIETIIETELARKEEILKIRDSQLKDMKHDRRVDSFRKQVIKSCEEIASSYEDTETDEQCLLYDGDDHKYEEAFKNFKIKKEIFESNSLCETEKPFLDLTNETEDSKVEDVIKDSPVIKSDNLSVETLFKEPLVSSIKIKLEEDIKVLNVDLPLKDTASDSKLLPVKIEINKIVQECEEAKSTICNEQPNANDNKNSNDLLTLNKASEIVPEVPVHSPDLESDEASNETTIFDAPSPSKRPNISFERIFKKSPSDDEEAEVKSIKTTEETDVPAEIVPNKCNEIEKKPINKNTTECDELPGTALKKTRFSWGKVEYADGKAQFQNVEIKLLNKDKSRVECSLCKLVTKNSKGRKAMNKMRTHIVATHCGVYQCPTCKKKCQDNCNLLVHMQSHDGPKVVPEENFVCQFCSQTWNSQAGLKIHIARKHNESAVKSSISTISLAVLKDTISMVQAPSIVEKTVEPITVQKRKVGRPAKVLRGPGRPPKIMNDPEESLTSLSDPGKPFPKQAGPGRPVTKLLGPEKPAKRPSEPIKSSESQTELGLPVKKYRGPGRPKSSETIKPSESQTEPGLPIKKHRGPGRPKKSESLDDTKNSVFLSFSDSSLINGKKILPPYAISYKTSSDSEKSDIDVLRINEKSNEKVKPISRKSRKDPLSLSQEKITHSDTYDEKGNSGISPNVCQSPKSPAAVPYIALSFNAHSDSEESDTNIEEFFNVKSSNKADPLYVDEIRKDTHKISPMNSRVAKAKDNRISTGNKPERIEVDLTESDSYNQDVMEVEEDDKMPIVMSTRSLAPAPTPLLQQILVNSTLTTQPASSFSVHSKPTAANSFNAVNANPTISVKTGSQIMNRSPTVPAAVFKAQTSTSATNSNIASSLVDKQKYMTFLHSLQTRDLKLVEIVRNRSNDCSPVAVLSNVTSNKLSCGSCGYQNQTEYENQAAALRAIKIHIYQKHFFTQSS